MLKKDAEAIKELFIAEEKVIFGFFDWEIKKRHFYSLASIIFALSLGLFVIQNLGKQGSSLSWSFVLFSFILSIIVTSIIIKYKTKKYNPKIIISKILERIIPLCTIALFFALIYLILNFFISNQILGFNDIVFLTSIATIFETITFHIH